MLNKVTKKLIAPAILDKPAMCLEKIPISTAGPEWYKLELNGGYTVHPVPIPVPIVAELVIKYKLPGNNQKLNAFRRGNAISGAPIKIGTNQLPKPPIKTGMTMKKIITIAWAVTKTLYNWWFPKNLLFPGLASSIRIITDIVVPATPEIDPNLKYKIAIRLWLVVLNHLSAKL